MAEIASAFVTIAPSARNFGTSLNRQVAPGVTSAGRSVGRVFGKAFLAAAAIAVTGVGLLLKGSVDEAREAQKVSAATEQILKSTGGVANVSAKQVERLASALSRKVGMDDELIQTGANLLLTFKNVRNEAGKNNDVFNQATRAAVDLSAAGFGSVDSASKMLGKALNDPVKGLTALSRAGVTFTEGQKDQIKAMVESGDVLGAQKKILKEVQSQVGGVAEATATSGEKASVAWGNLKEQIGTALLPVLDRLAVFFTTKIAPAISTFITQLQTGEGLGGRVAAVFRAIVGAIGGFITGLQNGTGKVGAFGNFIRGTLVPALSDLWGWISSKLVPALREGLSAVLDNAKKAFNTLRDAVADNRTELTQIWSAFKRVVTIIVTQVMPKVMAIASSVLPALAKAIGVAIDVVAMFVRGLQENKERFDRVREAIGNVIGKLGEFVSAVRQKVGNAIKFIREFPGKVKSVFSGALTILRNAGRDLIQGLINGITEKMNEAVQKVRDGLTKIKNMLPGSPIKEGPLKPWNDGSPGRKLMEMLARGIEEGSKTAENAMGAATKKLSDKAKEQIKKIRDQLASVKSEFAGLVEPIASNFTQGLFDFDTAGAFTANLQTVKGTLSTLLANFKSLIGAGLSPGFLYRLFQEGGPALINSLASLPQSEAKATGALFGEVTSLSDQLGTAVAGATDKGAALENQTQRLEKKLEKLTKHVDQSADRFAAAVNGAASSGRRRAA